MILERFDEEFENSITAEDFFKDVPCDEVINAKSLSIEDKARFLAFCIKNRCVNYYILLNLNVLLKGCTIKDDFFDEDYIVFNDFEDYIDVKLRIKNIIDELGEQMVKYFLGALKGYYTVLDCERINLGDFELSLIASLDLVTMSKLMKKSNVCLKDVTAVNNCQFIIESMLTSPSQSLFNNYMTLLN